MTRAGTTLTRLGYLLTLRLRVISASQGNNGSSVCRWGATTDATCAPPLPATGDEASTSVAWPTVRNCVHLEQTWRPLHESVLKRWLGRPQTRHPTVLKMSHASAHSS